VEIYDESRQMVPTMPPAPKYFVATPPGALALLHQSIGPYAGNAAWQALVLQGGKLRSWPAIHTRARLARREREHARRHHPPNLPHHDILFNIPTEELERGAAVPKRGKG
jgi:hypothetical protein